MKKIVILLIVQSLCLLLSAQQLDLVKNGESGYIIVIPEKSTTIELKAAMVMQDYLRRITGKELGIKQDNEGETEREILIGRVKRKVVQQLSLDELQEDGLWIKTAGNKLLIMGGVRKGCFMELTRFLKNILVAESIHQIALSSLNDPLLC